MSSAYRGYWLNGSKETGFTAMPFDGSDGSDGAPDTRLRCPKTGEVMKSNITSVKKAIDSIREESK